MDGLGVDVDIVEPNLCMAAPAIAFCPVQAHVTLSPVKGGTTAKRTVEGHSRAVSDRLPLVNLLCLEISQGHRRGRVKGMTALEQDIARPRELKR